MLFSFIRYTQPAWQFNLQPDAAGNCATCYFNGTVWGDETPDERYETESAQKADLGYRLWNKGVLLTATKDDIEALHRLPKPSLRDEYTFVRKYWGNTWASYALLIRLLTLHNPYREVAAYRSTKKVTRINPYAGPCLPLGYAAFQSPLVQSAPLVTVIIPTLNRYAYLADVLGDLAQQRYRNFEVIVVDQSDQFEEHFYSGYDLSIKLIRQKEKLLWTARNRAINHSEADYLLFFDDDSRVGPDWIEQHLKCLDFFESDISAGVSLPPTGQKIPDSYGYFRWSDQFDSGNAMVRRSVFERIGLFDELFNQQRMGDGEFGLRAYKHGLKSISNPLAARIHLKVGTGGLREMGHWDAFRTKQWFAPKPLPSVVYLYKKYFPPSFYRNAILLGIILSNTSFADKGNKGKIRLSVLYAILKLPLIVIQYLAAVKIAGKMQSAKKGYG